MDVERVGEILRTVMDKPSRRTLVRRIVAVAVTGLATLSGMAAGPLQTRAKKHKKKGKRKGHGKKPSPPSPPPTVPPSPPPTPVPPSPPPDTRFGDGHDGAFTPTNNEVY